ncbi:hypothetical protein CSC74_10075 [Pseudoxanthomonas yeongjuensis]|uniref:hypothetical protein n=1 Tax=Pseudoxanthomonas yeongjuensis TaxID=377616 RepID=UPI001391CA72|nr:hypothetical protein [Pseudoxanthomonas yeongjuensis]KAF1716191.1 hypothetical protein CSC74_10075 [Pseudoxanthomonas yeongjuensis]
MSQNLIDMNLTAENLSAIDTAFTQLETQLTGLLALTPAKRRELSKMGDKSEAFCRQAVNILSENPGILPRDFDLEGLQRDLATLDALRPRMIRFTKLYKRMQDTDMALGSDLMTGSLEGYAFLKVAGKGKGLDELKKMLAARFSRRSPAAPPEDPAASQ